MADYEKAIQTAFKEVSNAPAGRATYAAQFGTDRDRVKPAGRYCEFARARYRTGTGSFLTLLTAQE